jgi:hypothetical protein
MWIEGSIIGVPYYAPTENAPVIYMNSVNEDDPNWLPNQWNNVVVPGIPDNARAVQLTGLLIISPGETANETPDLHLRFRRWLPGNNLYLPPYIGQACASVTTGARHPFSVWVPVDWRRFQVYWTRSTPPPWPQHASYGFNAYVNAYLR